MDYVYLKKKQNKTKKKKLAKFKNLSNKKKISSLI